MKFDNAFLTSKGNVGMQFKHNGQIITAYQDHNKELVCDETYQQEVKDQLFKRYEQLHKFYVKH